MNNIWHKAKTRFVFLGLSKKRYKLRAWYTKRKMLNYPGNHVEK